MKKVLVATCVVAMTAFGITNASADPVATARGNAYGADVGGSLLDGIVEREPEVTSVLPPGGRVSEDIITIPADPVTINGTGVVIADTQVESTIVPFMGSGEGAAAPGGTLGDDPAGLLGGILEDTLGGDTLGIASAGDSGRVRIQQLDDTGLLGGTLGGDLLGGLLDQGPGGELVSDSTIAIPVANAQGFARIDDLNIVVSDAADFGGLPDEIVAVLVDALLEIDAVSAEAVAVCAADQVFFDTASSVVAVNDEGVDIVDDLLGTVGDLLPEGLVTIETGEVGVTPDGTGVFTNALRISILEGTATGGIIPGTEEIDPVTGLPIPGTGLPEVEPGENALLNIVLAHAEVSATTCAAPPPALVPTGDPGPSLPRTGGLGVLPAVLGVGLLGGALTAGRFALRARRNGDSL
ncbi:MAG: hypothetical protein KY452_11010 [Actinobacteria bacterium]|nr:hypothetical protein [Actinomycetota bacterium]